MIAAGYFRQAAKRGPSLALQQRAFLDYCERQGYEVAATFTEDGAGDGQTAFAALVEFLRRPEKGFVVLVADSPAVFADEPGSAAARFLEIESLGARVQFMTGEADPLEAVLAGWQNGSAAGLGDRVRSAMHRKAIRGEVLGRPPYGYHVGARNRLERVEDEAVVVRYIFRLYLVDGLGIRLVARRLNEEGLRTRRNQPWSMVTIRDILKNRAYLGTYQRFGVRVPGTHPALVSPDDFRKVQERLSERRTNFSPRKVTPFLLSGLAECSHCGNRLIGVSRRQSWKRKSDGAEQAASYRYYQCESRTNQGICGYHTRREEVLEEEVRRWLAELNPRQIEAAGDDAAVLSEWQEESRRLRDRLHQIDRRIGRSLEAASTAKISREKLRSDGLVLAEEHLRVEEDLRLAEWRSGHYASSAERRRARQDAIARLVDRWDALAIPERQELLREVIDRIVVSDDSIKVVLRP
jgi:site-specific DNA recombinase